MVKKRISRRIQEFCGFCDYARSDPARQVRFGIKTGASYGQEGRMEEWSQEILNSVTNSFCKLYKSFLR